MVKLNDLGYEVLSDKMEELIFGCVSKNKPKHSISEIKTEMESFGISFPISNPPSYKQDVSLPPLLGDNISEHYENIAKKLVSESQQKLREFSLQDLPEYANSDFELVSSWQMFKDGVWSVVDYPLEDVFVFDTETFVKGSSFGHPIIATAVSSQAYYLWLHPALCDSNLDYVPTLVDIGENKIVIAHNAAFDHCRVKSSYFINNTNKWFDTMSAHINVSGLASGQRFYFAKNNSTTTNPYAYRPAWAEHGAMNNLIDCYKFHTFISDIEVDQDKSLRDIFVKADSLSEISDNLTTLVDYAFKDVRITKQLFDVLFIKYGQANPSSTTLVGHFALMDSFLPVVKDWDSWFKNCEILWEQALDKESEILKSLALEIWDAYNNGELDIESDPWLSAMDWEMNTKLTKKGKPASKWYGIPNWLRSISEILPDKTLKLKNISSKTIISHHLLRLKWKNSPLIFIKGQGWGYNDPVTGTYTKIPHPALEGANVGNVLSKDFLADMEEGTLSSDLPQAQEVINLAVAVSYWTSVRSRVAAENVENFEGFNAISPQVVPHNTATNRGGCALWFTVPDPKKDKIGSEIKTRVQAPGGWTFVQSDYDGQESVIAALFGDSYHGISGSNPFSFSVFVGDKSNGTDMHSMTAKSIGISRQVAKNCGYAMLYGSGAKTLANTIRKGNKSLSIKEATALSNKLIQKKKGKKAYKGSRDLVGGSDSYVYNEMARIACQPIPTNPLSGTKMSTAFRPSIVGDDFWTMRNNWVIQSTGAAMLHAFITGAEYLISELGLSAKFCISIHDSITYMCKESDAETLAAVFQVAHLWSWAWLRHNYNIYDVPVSNAWFSSVEIDKIMRKSANASTLTISQPFPESEGKAYSFSQLAPILDRTFQ